MVEVTPQRSEISISYWKFLAFLAFLLLLGLLGLYGVFASQWGAANPFAEMFRKYLSVANRFRPGAKPEDNLASALRLHGLEKIGDKRFALLCSVTDRNGDPLVTLAPTAVTVRAGTNRAGVQAAIVDRVTPLHLRSGWPDPVSFASVMDYSGSMFPEDLQALETNYTSFVNALVMPFAGSVFKFNDRVEEIISLTGSKSDFEAAVKKPISLENTALYQGLDKGIANLQARPHLRFVLVSTDGNDNAGGATLEEVIRRSQSHHVSLFVLGFGWLNVDVLKKLANETDGYYVYVPDSSELSNWFPKLARIVNNVQVIEFSTSAEMSLPGAVDLEVTAGGTTLRRSL